MPHLTILTGASRGMGLAMATRLCINDAVVLCISRQASAELAATAQAQGAHLTQWQADLAEPVPVGECREVSCPIGDEVSGLITMVVNDDGMGNALTVGCNDQNNTDTVEVDECAPPG